MKFVLVLGILLFLLPNNIYAKEKTYNEVKVSWYARGLKDPNKLTTACWAEFPKGTRFLVKYGSNSVMVVCDDRGRFKSLGRFLDLSSGAFKRLAPLSRGILTVSVEVMYNSK